MANPISSFCACKECGAKINQECKDCLNHSSRMDFFIKKASLEKRVEAQNWTFNDLPEGIKKLMLLDKASLYLNAKEYALWRESIKLKK